jgi:hypothetical protein
MQMVLAPNDLFSWNNNTMKHNAMTDIYTTADRCTLTLTLCMIVPWSRDGVVFFASRHFCYVFTSPLSGLNWISLAPTGGPGPPSPKVACLPLGSTHTPFPGSRTLIIHETTSWGSDGLMRDMICKGNYKQVKTQSIAKLKKLFEGHY